MPFYHLFGIGLWTNDSLPIPKSPCPGGCDLHLVCQVEPPRIPNPDSFDALWHNELDVPTGRWAITLFELEDGFLLRYAPHADYYIRGDQVICHLKQNASRLAVHWFFMSVVLAFWLECQGVTTLHASAVVAGERAVAFLAGPGGGKSTLAAAFTACGSSLLTDDILSIDVTETDGLARPGFPKVRLWPDAACMFVDDVESCEYVYPGRQKRALPVGTGGFGAFCDQAVPLSCIYVTERKGVPGRSGKAEISPVLGAEAVLELVRGSFSPRLIAAVGLEADQLDRLAQIARKVPVRRLHYPSGLANLERVRQAVALDIAAL